MSEGHHRELSETKRVTVRSGLLVSERRGVTTELRINDQYSTPKAETSKGWQQDRCQKQATQLRKLVRNTL